MLEQNVASNAMNYDRPRTLETTGNGCMPPNTIRTIQINQINHGYIVQVGCQTFAIESPSNLIAKLAEYINNPAATEEKLNQGKLF
jgi:hypothetical protein